MSKYERTRDNSSLRDGQDGADATGIGGGYTMDYEIPSNYNAFMSEVLACTFYAIGTTLVRMTIYAAGTTDLVVASILQGLGTAFTVWGIAAMLGRSSGVMMLPWYTLLQALFGRLRRPGSQKGEKAALRYISLIVAQLAAPAAGVALVLVASGAIGQGFDLGAPFFDNQSTGSSFVAVGWNGFQGTAAVALATWFVIGVHMLVSHDHRTSNPAAAVGVAYGAAAAFTFMFSGGEINPAVQFWARLISFNTAYAGYVEWIYFIGSLIGAAAVGLTYAGWYLLSFSMLKKYASDDDYVMRGGTNPVEPRAQDMNDSRLNYDGDFGDNDRPNRNMLHPYTKEAQGQMRNRSKKPLDI